LLTPRAYARQKILGTSKCAEIACLDKALNDGIEIKGGSVKAVNIGISGKGHGTRKSACCIFSRMLITCSHRTCSHILTDAEHSI
jgi:hypothetical protein